MVASSQPRLAKASSAEKVKLPVHLHLLSGALSGLSSCVLLQPLDLLKTRIQQGKVSTTLTTTNFNVVQVARSVLKQDGIFGLWRGTAPTVIRNVPGVAMYFYSLTELRSLFTTLSTFSQPTPIQTSHTSRQLTTVLPKLTPLGDLIAGATARTGVGFILMPVTVIKTRFESNLYAYTSIQHAFSSILSKGGIQALWSGFIPTTLRDAPYAGLFVLSYEYTKSFLITTTCSSNTGPSLIHGLSGSIGAIFATVVTTPFDYIKTQQQIKPDVYNNLKQSIVKTWQSERGWKVFFEGSSLRIARKASSSAIGWTIYEGLIRRWAQ